MLSLRAPPANLRIESNGLSNVLLVDKGAMGCQRSSGLTKDSCRVLRRSRGAGGLQLLHRLHRLRKASH